MLAFSHPATNLFTLKSSLKITLNNFEDVIDALIRAHFLEKPLRKYAVVASASVLSHLIARGSVYDADIRPIAAAVVRLDTRVL